MAAVASGAQNANGAANQMACVLRDQGINLMGPQTFFAIGGALMGDNHRLLNHALT